MATIRTETARGVRILAHLTAGQTFGLLLTGAAAWAVWSSAEPGVAGAVLAAAVAAGGGAYTVGRWPLGGDGERVAIWLARLARFAWERRVRAGAAAVGWAGGFEVVDLSIAEPTLETVFIHLTGKELRD
jgi:ABC-2 type transport system ATP-binding protein